MKKFLVIYRFNKISQTTLISALDIESAIITAIGELRCDVEDIIQVILIKE